MVEENENPMMTGMLDGTAGPVVPPQPQPVQPETSGNYERELLEQLKNMTQKVEQLEAERSLFQDYPIWYRFLHSAKERSLRESYDIAVYDKQFLEDKVDEIKRFSDSSKTE